MFFAALTIAFATAAETTNITAIINAKHLKFTSDDSAQVSQKALELLASCTYLNANPKWGAGGSEPLSIVDAQKQSHLHLSFSSPVKVEVPIVKATLRVREMVISLPLVTGAIWVRSEDKVLFLAKFDHKAHENLQHLLEEAQKP